MNPLQPEQQENGNIPIDERRLRVAATKELRRRLERHGTMIGTNDGTNKESLREWMDAIDRAGRFTEATDRLVMELVGCLAQGPLARVIVSFLENTPEAANRTWDHTKAEIRRLYLSEEEAQQLRARLNEQYQKPYEDVKDYGRAFKLATSRAYTDEQQQGDMVQEQLVRLFISGLRDQRVKHDVFATRPANLDAAIRAASVAAHTVALSELPSRGERKEEPMDISALPPPPLSLQSDPAVDEIRQLVKTLQGEVKSMSKINKTQVQVQPPAQPSAAPTIYMQQPPAMPSQYPFPPPYYPGMYPYPPPPIPRTPSPALQPEPIIAATTSVAENQGNRGGWKGNGREGKGPVICYFCQGKGHIAMRCPKKQAQQQAQLQAQVQAAVMAAVGNCQQKTNGLGN